jgi:signal transduction histidine kinase
VDRVTAKTPRQLWTVDEQDIDILGVSSVVLTRRLWMYAVGFIAVLALFSGWIVALRKSNRATTAANATLEKRVTERTSELQKAQTELQRALEQERELGELKSRFVTMVSHEFRTPLGIIMSAVELLQHYSDRLPEEEKKLQLHEIQASTKHMGGLMEQVLLLGRAEAGKLTCKPQPLDLISFAERIIDETHSITTRKCPITLQTEGDLTGARVDEALLRHILGNLVSNAVKYSPAGAEVLIQLRREGPNAALIITERGIGIPEKDRERLFEAFHRCSNVGEIQGTGLGLVIVKRCVDLHSGSLDLQSEVGKGTTFTVRLPVFVA